MSRDYRPKDHCLYLIFDHLTQCWPDDPTLYNTLSELSHSHQEYYVGITGNEIKKRWKDHAAQRNRVNQNTTAFIKEHSLTIETGLWVLFDGTKEECLLLEYALRPRPGMGLNKAVGGNKETRRYCSKIAKMLSEVV